MDKHKKKEQKKHISVKNLLGNSIQNIIYSTISNQMHIHQSYLK